MKWKNFLLAKVLIETLWNVKNEVWSSIGNKAQVLIETLWNVKRKEIEEKYGEDAY